MHYYVVIICINVPLLLVPLKLEEYPIRIILPFGIWGLGWIRRIVCTECLSWRHMQTLERKPVFLYARLHLVLLCMRAIPKSTSNWLVKKVQNREQNLFIWNSYIYNCINSPNSCHPHLGTCTVALVFAVRLQRTVPPRFAASQSVVLVPTVHNLSVTIRSLWKFFRKFRYRETTFSTQALVDFLNEFISHNWMLFLTTFVMHISAPILEFSTPFSHTTVTHNIITLYTTQLTMNLRRALSFCVKKTNHSTYLTAGGSGDDSVHVSSVITPTLRSENVWG
jgi:hypothetical protein